MPHGLEAKARTLHEIEIINDGSHLDRPDYGNYVVRVDGKNSFKIKNHKRSLGVLALLQQALLIFDDQLTLEKLKVFWENE